MKYCLPFFHHYLTVSELLHDSYVANGHRFTFHPSHAQCCSNILILLLNVYSLDCCFLFDPCDLSPTSYSPLSLWQTDETMWWCDDNFHCSTDALSSSSNEKQTAYLFLDSHVSPLVTLPSESHTFIFHNSRSPLLKLTWPEKTAATCIPFFSQTSQCPLAILITISLPYGPAEFLRLSTSIWFPS